MARKKESEEKNAPATPEDTCPTFVLRADNRDHLLVLRDLVVELQNRARHTYNAGLADEIARLQGILREFDLYEETHR